MTLWPEVTFTEREKKVAKDVAIRILVTALVLSFFFGGFLEQVYERSFGRDCVSFGWIRCK